MTHLEIQRTFGDMIGRECCRIQSRSRRSDFKGLAAHNGCTPCYYCISTTGSMKIAPRLLLLLFFIANAGFAESINLSLASGSGAPGATISLDLILASNQPAVAAVQWTFTYWATDVAGIDVAAGPAAVSAGKSVTCRGGAGTVNCLLWGLNTNIIPNGVVARVKVTLA